MNSGSYIISRISCHGCANYVRDGNSNIEELPVIGWTYVKSMNDENKFKEGKVILEIKFINRENWNQVS